MRRTTKSSTQRSKVPAGDLAALFNLGNTLFEQGNTEAAIEAFQGCRAIVPNNVGICYNLGNALLKAERAFEAVEPLQTCLRLNPNFGPAYVNLANALRRLALLEPAQEMAELGVRHLPSVPEAQINLANVLHDRADYASAAAIYRQVLAREPRHAGALSSLGNTLQVMGHCTDALTLHRQAVAAEPGNPEFRFSLAAALLARGDFAQGWVEYESRWQCAHAPRRGFGEAWRGEDIAGRTILLHAEQGLGDTLQFVRYVAMVAERGARVLLEVQPPLVRLMQCLPGVAQVLASGSALPPFDAHCPLLSLPRAFKTRLDSIPATLPYLHAEPDASASWHKKLPEGPGLRIGLVWAGSPHTNDPGAYLINQRRSLGEGQLAPLADVQGVHLISLQKDPPQTSPGLTLIDPMREVSDFADTAALVANLDLVISVDTSVAHLAGALGRPVWLLSRYDGCWRWLHGRDDSPWYPNMRIYWQKRPRDWPSVIERVRSDLMERAQEHSPGSPVARMAQSPECREKTKVERARQFQPDCGWH